MPARREGAPGPHDILADGMVLVVLLRHSGPGLRLNPTVARQARSRLRTDRGRAASQAPQSSAPAPSGAPGAEGAGPLHLDNTRTLGPTPDGRPVGPSKDASDA
jgi:hypothetical protein